MTEKDFAAVFAELTALFAPYRSEFFVKEDLPGSLYLEIKHDGKVRPEHFFGAVRIQRRYVSSYLMPVYSHPELLENISPKLRRRMQGKSCFNFTRADPALFVELGDLVKQGFGRYRDRGIV